MPGGRGRRVGTLGGYGLAVSRSSAHPREAVALIRFLLAKELQLKTEPAHHELATEPELYQLPQVLQAYAASPQPNQQGSQLVSRPSNVTGQTYEAVTEAYVRAVHFVLTGERSAPMAAAALEKQLIAITGFKAGPPKAWK